MENGPGCTKLLNVKAYSVRAGYPYVINIYPCLLYTSDAADERSSVDLGGRRIIKKKKKQTHT